MSPPPVGHAHVAGDFHGKSIGVCRGAGGGSADQNSQFSRINDETTTGSSTIASGTHTHTLARTYAPYIHARTRAVVYFTTRFILTTTCITGNSLARYLQTQRTHTCTHTTSGV